jgi:hypothetical protein
MFSQTYRGIFKKVVPENPPKMTFPDTTLLNQEIAHMASWGVEAA